MALEPISCDGHIPPDTLQLSHLGKLRQGICRNVSPALPNCHHHQLMAPLLQALLPTCLLGGTTSPRAALIPEIPPGPSIASFASSCPVCPAEVQPSVLLSTSLTKPGFPAGIFPFQTLSVPPHLPHRSTGHDGDTGPLDLCPGCLPGSQHPLPGRNRACVSL